MDEQQALTHAMSRIMKHARDLVECQQTSHTIDVYRRMQHIGVSLAGLASAVVAYDETVEYFKANQKGS